jgi:hypothetical protein
LALRLGTRRKEEKEKEVPYPQFLTKTNVLQPLPTSVTIEIEKTALMFAWTDTECCPETPHFIAQPMS